MSQTLRPLCRSQGAPASERGGGEGCAGWYEGAVNDGDRDDLRFRAEDGRSGQRARDLRRCAGWSSAARLLAALLSLASLAFSLFTFQSSYVTRSDGQAEALNRVATTFYPWGSTSTTTTGVALQVAVPGGPNYALAILPCVVLLMTAAVIPFLPQVRRRPAQLLERIGSVAAPVAAGGLTAVSACQLLSFRASSSPFEPRGVYAGDLSGPEWFLGPSPQLLAVGALTALATCVLVALVPTDPFVGLTRHAATLTSEEGANIETRLPAASTAPSTTTPAPPSTRPDPPLPAAEDVGHTPPLDPALFQRPTNGST